MPTHEPMNRRAHPVRDGPGGAHPDLAGDWPGAISEAVEAHYADVSGGLWLDQAAGEVVVMLTPSAPDGVLDDLRSLAPSPDRVVCMEADHSQAELDERALAAIVVEIPSCAEVADIPDDATPLPGGGSTCGGMMALLTGTLVGDDRCVWVETDAGDPVGVAWPRAWWVDDHGVVHDHTGAPRAAVGDAVELGGGLVPDTDTGCGPSDEGRWLVSSLSEAG